MSESKKREREKNERTRVDLDNVPPYAIEVLVQCLRMKLDEDNWHSRLDKIRQNWIPFVGFLLHFRRSMYHSMNLAIVPKQRINSVIDQSYSDKKK